MPVFVLVLTVFLTGVADDDVSVKAFVMANPDECQAQAAEMVTLLGKENKVLYVSAECEAVTPGNKA